MDAKRKLEKERSSAISESLKNLEHSSSKKFVFSSDSEDGVEVVVRSVTVFFLIFFFILRLFFFLTWKLHKSFQILYHISDLFEGKAKEIVPF